MTDKKTFGEELDALFGVYDNYNKNFEKARDSLVGRVEGMENKLEMFGDEVYVVEFGGWAKWTICPGGDLLAGEGNLVLTSFRKSKDFFSG